MEKRHAAALLLAVLLSFPGCSAVLERSYDVVEPHNSQYWEDGTSSALRAEDYQSLVNGLLMLVCPIRRMRDWCGCMVTAIRPPPCAPWIRPALR